MKRIQATGYKLEVGKQPIAFSHTLELKNTANKDDIAESLSCLFDDTIILQITNIKELK